MLYIRPTDNGYEAYDIYHHLVFVEKDCDLLFSFLESSSEKITDLLKTYFDKRIDLKTLSKKDGKVSKSLCEGIKKEMERIQHPVPREEYFELYRHLLQPMISIGMQPLPPAIVPTSDAFMGRYYSQLEAIYEKKVGKPGFNYLEIVREEAERYVYWVLDQSAFRFKELDRGARVRLYSRVFRKSIIDSDLRFVSRYFWKEPEAYDYFANSATGHLIEGIQSGLSVEDASARAEQQIQERQDRKDMAQYLALLNSDRQQLSDELKAFMDAEISSAKEETSATLFEEYQVNTLYELIQLQMWLLSKGETIVKRCRHCGRLFVAEKPSIDYCARIMDGETEPCNAYRRERLPPTTGAVTDPERFKLSAGNV